MVGIEEVTNIRLRIADEATYTTTAAANSVALGTSVATVATRTTTATTTNTSTTTTKDDGGEGNEELLLGPLLDFDGVDRRERNVVVDSSFILMNK